MISEKTKVKIQQVASVCIRCRRCMKECIMLNRFAQNPKVLFAQYLEKGPENMDRAIAYSCNECSQCTLKCPKGLNLKAVFQSLKEDYAAENAGIVPLEALLPSELGQDRECAPEYCTALSAGQGVHQGKARYLFVPGQFPPAPILSHLRSALGEGNVDMLETPVLSQADPALLSRLESSQDQVLITACPSGYQTLRQAFPQRKVLFYWDLMHDLIGLPETHADKSGSPSLKTGGTVSESIRWVLSQLNCQTEPVFTDSPDPDRDCRQILGLLFS